MKNYTILSLLLVASGLIQAMNAPISNSILINGSPLLYQAFKAPGHINFAIESESYEHITIIPYYPSKTDKMTFETGDIILKDKSNSVIIKKEHIKNSRILTEFLLDNKIDPRKPILELPIPIKREARLLANALKIPDFDKEYRIKNLLKHEELYQKYDISSDKIDARMEQLITRPESITSPEYIAKLLRLTQGNIYASIRSRLAQCILSRCKLQDSELKKLEFAVKEIIVPRKSIHYFGEYYYLGDNTLIISPNGKKITLEKKIPIPDACGTIILIDTETKKVVMQPKEMKVSERSVLFTPDSQQIITHDNFKFRSYDTKTLKKSDCAFFDKNKTYHYSEAEHIFRPSSDKKTLLQLVYPRRGNFLRIYTMNNGTDSNSTDKTSYIDFTFEQCNPTVREEIKNYWKNTNIWKNYTTQLSMEKQLNLSRISNDQGIYLLDYLGYITFSPKMMFWICKPNQISKTATIRSLTGDILATLENTDKIKKFAITSDDGTIYGITDTKLYEWTFTETIRKKFPINTTLEEALNRAHQEAREKEGISSSTHFSN
ncbi:MAG: hypothetical protein WC707_01665 [Candidatus Babeliaceae bacterium]|jgi:hypothetical protein